VIASCQGALNPSAFNTKSISNRKNTRERDHDLNEELSDVDEFELTKSYNGHTHTAAS